MSSICYKTQIGLSTKNYLKSSKGQRINESQIRNVKYSDYKIAHRNLDNEEKWISGLQGKKYQADSRPSTYFRKERRSYVENQSSKNINNFESNENKMKSRRTPSHQCRKDVANFHKEHPKAPISFIKKFEEQQFIFENELQSNSTEPFKTLGKFPSMNSQKTNLKNSSQDSIFSKAGINNSHNVLRLDKGKLIAPYKATPESHNNIYNMLQNIVKREKEEVNQNNLKRKEIFGGNSLSNGKKLNKSNISYLANDSFTSYAIMNNKPSQCEKFFITIHLDNKSFCSEISQNNDEINPTNNQITKKQSLQEKDLSKNTNNIIIEHSKNAKLINYVAVINSPKFKVLLNKFTVYQGNNSNLVKSILLSRPWWIQLPFHSSLFHFKWHPVSGGINFTTLSSKKLIPTQMVNHFEYHGEISKKNNLFYNLQFFLDAKRENVFQYVPLTFVIDINSQKISMRSLHNFTIIFNILEANKTKIKPFLSVNDNNELSENFNKKIIYENKLGTQHNQNKHLSESLDRRKIPSNVRFIMPLCHFVGNNIWILKPTSLNRGRGIIIFNDLSKLKEILYENLQPKGIKKSEFNLNCDKEFVLKNDDIIDYSKMIEGYVIQKYIENPLLINKRKFDIRVWVLVNQENDCFYFKEGYLRTSSNEYSIDNIQNNYVHLTNNAIQKKSSKYGKFEDGNQLSFQEFQGYIQSNFSHINFYSDIIPQIKNHIILSLLSVKKKLNPEERKFCFEIFGYDFIIDNDFNTWLIEVNTNPCLELSSKLLKSLIPRMIDDAFKLSLDIKFQPYLPYQNQRKNDYPVKGYQNDENIWEKLISFKGEHNNMHLIKPLKLKSKRIYNITDTKGLQIINCDYLYKRKTEKSKNHRKGHMNSVMSLIENVDINEQII